MSGGLRIARIFGIPIYLHPSWFLVFALVTALLMQQPLPIEPEWGTGGRALLAVAASLLFFASIVLHELGHSVIALRRGVTVRSVTLFILGGVAMMEREPDTPRAELEIAIAGPVVSAGLALLFTIAELLFEPESAPALLAGWLVTINFLVAAFNLLPGFPLDGGRVLRAYLWARSGDPLDATRSAAQSGRAIAYALIGLGALVALLGGQLVSGLWLAFIGWFLLSASDATLRQASAAGALQGLVARDVMSFEVPRIDAGASVAHFGRELLMRGHGWAFVDEGGQITGLVTLSDIARVPDDGWAHTPIRSVATPIAEVLSARPDLPVRDLLVEMGSRRLSQIPVVDGDRIVGAVTRETLARAVELRRP